MPLEATDSDPVIPAVVDPRRSLARRRLLLSLLVPFVMAGLFGWYIWPTQYRYDYVNIRGNVYPVRIERWSGRAEVMYPSGWKPIDGNEKSNPAGSNLPSYDISLLQTNGERSGSYIYVHLYNGSSYQVTQISVELVVWDKTSNHEIIRRLYDVSSSYSGPSVRPRSSSQFSFDSHFRLGAEHAWTYRLVGAKGYPQE